MDATAAVLTADRTIEIRRIALPGALPAGGAMLAVQGCGMCGSDIEQYEGGAARAGYMSFPCIPGHETVGRIAVLDAEGRRRWGCKEGDRVAVYGPAPCGACQPCMNGGRCVDAFYYGFRSLHDGSGLWGGYSDFMEIAPRTKLYPLSDLLSVEDALLFNPLAAGFDWALRLGALKAGETVLVLGAGQRGLACVLAAADAGAAQIIVTGLRADAWKLDVARRFGATATLIVEDSDVPDAVHELTGGRGADLVVDTTPKAFQPVADAIKAVRNGGRIVLGGIKGRRAMPDFPIDDLMMKQITMAGALASSHWGVTQAIRLIESGRYPISLMHSHSLPVEKLEYAIQLLAGEIPGKAALHISIVSQAGATLSSG